MAMKTSLGGSCFLGDTDPIPYPCKFPIKVMGLRQDGFAEVIVEIVSRHDEAFDPAGLQMRPSAKGNYLSFTAIVNAISREQLDNIYRELTSHPMVKIVL